MCLLARFVLAPRPLIAAFFVDRPYRASWGSQDWQTRVGLWEICATDEALPFEETDFCYEWGDETFDENNIPFADIPTVIHMTRFFAIMAGQSPALRRTLSSLNEALLNVRSGR